MRFVSVMPHVLAFLDSLGTSELFFIGVLALLMFGSKRLPELGRGLGRAIREFKRATSGVEENIREVLREEPSPTIRPPLRQGPPRNPAYPFAQPTLESPAAEPPLQPDPAPTSATPDPSVVPHTPGVDDGAPFDASHHDTTHHGSTSDTPRHDGGAGGGTSHDSSGGVPPHS